MYYVYSFFVSGTESFHSEIRMKLGLTTGERVYSDKFYMNNVPWRISAAVTSENSDFLGIFLRCDEKVGSQLKVNVTLNLTSTADKEHEISNNGITSKFTVEKKGWGWPKFVTLSDLEDKKKGLMINGVIVVKISVQFVQK